MKLKHLKPAKINWAIFVLVCLFSSSSWLISTSIWTELPLIVYELEEGWRLPSILSVFCQLAQLPPILIYPVLKLKFPRFLKNRNIIRIKYLIETISLIVLLFVWQKTVNINGEKRSIGLYSVNFIVSLLNGLSTVTYLPYLQEYSSNQYIISNYIGESFTSVIPSSLVFMQNINDVENHAECNHTRVNVKTTANFSINIYFTLILVCMLVSFVSFWLLDKKLRKMHRPTTDRDTADEIEINPIERERLDNIDEEKIEQNSSNEKVILLSLAFIASFLLYGFLLGLQSYSTLSYGHETFHLSINLSNLFLMIAMFLTIWSYENINLRRIVSEFIVGILFSVYIVIVSFYSPCPPLVNHVLGSPLIIFTWICTQCILLRSRCLIASKLEKYKEQNLLILLGIVTLVGQMIGGLVIYLLVDVLRLFSQKPNCVSTINYCK